MILTSKLRSLDQLGNLLKSINIRKPFLVTGSGFYDKCGAKAYIDTISAEFDFIIFSDFSDNPKSEDIKKGIEQFLLTGSDCIIAIGGGSVIDMAKSINGLANESPGMIEESIKSNKIHLPLLPFIAVPTTAGSGSEATHFAVVYIAGRKYSLAHPDLIPSHVILDTRLLKTQSGYQMAVSGIDAFSQAVESLWSINSTEESREYSIGAIKLLWRFLPVMLKKKDSESMECVMEGAHLAGMAINITKTTAPHALAYGFTTHCGLPHGHAVALSLPYFTHLHAGVNKCNCADPRGEAWVRDTLISAAECIGVTLHNLSTSFYSFITSCGIELNFSRLGITQATFRKVVKEINAERLGNNPVAVNEKELLGIYDFNNSFPFVIK